MAAGQWQDGGRTVAAPAEPLVPRAGQAWLQEHQRHRVHCIPIQTPHLASVGSSTHQRGLLIKEYV